MLNSQPRAAALPTHDRGQSRDREQAAVVSLPDGPAMSQPQAAPAPRPKFDNKGQYSRTSILRYEKIFGEHYISTGGHETTEDLCRRLAGSLHPGVRVLDVGSGIGGAAFHLARAFGAKVTGIDLAEEMVAIALEHAGATGALGRGQLRPWRCPRDAVPGEVRHHLEPGRSHAHPRQGPSLLPASRPAGGWGADRDHRLRPGQDTRLAGVRGLHRQDGLPASSSPSSTASFSEPPASRT